MSDQEAGFAADPCDGIEWPATRNRLAPLAQRASMQDMLRLMGMPERQCAPHAGMPVPVWRVHEEAVVLHEGEHPHTLFVVRSGSFKCVRTLEDGYEQVVSFVQPGTLIGIEALHAGVQATSAVALEDATVYALSAQELPQMQQQCPALHEALWRSLCRQFMQATEIAEMMAAVASDARLARFILWLSRRMAEAGQSPRRLHLRMGRRDIASLLGVAHETVSRSFTLLADKGCLHVHNREIEIIDMQALQQRARSTRGLPGDGADAASGARRVRGPARAPAWPVRAGAPGSWWGSLQAVQTA